MLFRSGLILGGERDYGVGMFFFPQDTLRRNQAMKMFQLIVAREGMEFIGWRQVPVCPQVLGQKARDKMPRIFQGFVRRPKGLAKGLEFDRRLYIARREFEQSGGGVYVASLSSRTIVYKGMFLVGSCGSSTLISGTRDIPPRLLSFTPDFLPTPTHPGNGPTPTV